MSRFAAGTISTKRKLSSMHAHESTSDDQCTSKNLISREQVQNHHERTSHPKTFQTLQTGRVGSGREGRNIAHAEMPHLLKSVNETITHNFTKRHGIGLCDGCPKLTTGCTTFQNTMRFVRARASSTRCAAHVGETREAYNIPQQKLCSLSPLSSELAEVKNHILHMNIQLN